MKLTWIKNAKKLLITIYPCGFNTYRPSDNTLPEASLKRQIFRNDTPLPDLENSRTTNNALINIQSHYCQFDATMRSLTLVAKLAFIFV